MITINQIRAARGLLNWGTSDLARLTGFTREAITRIESGTVQPRESTMVKIARAFDAANIEFIENQGVRYKKVGIEVYEGADRFEEFTNFLYEHLKTRGGDVCVNATDERLFAKYRKDHELHRKRMKELYESGNITFRIIATESNFTSEYAQHRHQPSQNAVPTAFYVFGDCLALISFVHTTPPYVAVIQSKPLADAYRQSFNVAWENAKESS